MKRSLTVMLACLFALGLATAACDNPLRDALNCLSGDVTDCQDDYNECTAAIDSASETYSEEMTACSEDLCDCYDDKGCDEFLGSSCD